MDGNSAERPLLGFPSAFREADHVFGTMQCSTEVRLGYEEALTQELLERHMLWHSSRNHQVLGQALTNWFVSICSSKPKRISWLHCSLNLDWDQVVCWWKLLSFFFTSPSFRIDGTDSVEIREMGKCHQQLELYLPNVWGERSLVDVF